MCTSLGGDTMIVTTIEYQRTGDVDTNRRTNGQFNRSILGEVYMHTDEFESLSILLPGILITHEHVRVVSSDQWEGDTL